METITPKNPSKECTRCHRSLPATTDYFFKTEKTKPGLRPYCRDCTNETRRLKHAPNKKRDVERHGYCPKSGAIPEYHSWCAMIKRCENPKDHAYRNYGGRGILVCQQWHAFSVFLADMGRRPSSSHSIDRINNDGNYEPSNCRWATKIEQSSNTRQAIKVTFSGVTDTISGWARRLGIKHSAMQKRLSRLPLDIALTAPVRRR